MSWETALKETVSSQEIQLEDDNRLSTLRMVSQRDRLLPQFVLDNGVKNKDQKQLIKFSFKKSM